MARCSFATWHPLPETNTEPLINVKAIVFHTAVSSAYSLYNFFNSTGVDVESHFYNRQDGSLEQYVDTAHQADAQFDGNAYAVSCESWDGAQGGVPYVAIPWTPAQLESNARLAAWAHDVHGVELVKAYKHSDGTIHGVGYHAQFTQEWNRNLHSCPGAPRIAQMPALIARAIEISGGDMAFTNTDLGTMVHTDGVIKAPDGGDGTNLQWTLESYLKETFQQARDAHHDATDAKAAVAALAAQVAANQAATEAVVAAAVAKALVGLKITLSAT